MSLDWMARQLATRPTGMRLEVSRYNPRPPGVMRPDGTAFAILQMLQQFPGRYFTFGEVMVRINCTKKAADWGLIYLKSQGYIECSTDEGRNSRYLRYAYIKAKP